MNNITGQKFNRLTVIKPDGKYKSGNIKWLCECECGNLTHATSYSLRTGEVKSCGCYASDRMKKINTKHSGFGTRLYEIWRQMHRRCYGKNTVAYKHYGGRGITICKEWNEFVSFRDWALANGYQENLTIDRIDVNGNYEPSNCRWATIKQQSNNRRSSHYVMCGDEKHTVSEWADIVGIEQRRLWQLLNKNGWNIEPFLKGVV